MGKIGNLLKNVYIQNMLVWGIVLLILLLCLVSLNYILVNMGDELQNVNIATSLTNHVKANNLSLPLPNMIEVSTSQFDYKSDFYLRNFGEPINEFVEILDNYYIYEENTYDCKYWSYVWSLYWKHNAKKYNWNIKYITTSNHVFVMVYNQSGYIIMDENNVTCFGKMGC